MGLFKKTSRRNVFKTGLAAVTAAAVSAPDAHAGIAPKAPGETKVVAIMGHDSMHNAATSGHVSSLSSWTPSTSDRKSEKYA